MKITIKEHTRRDGSKFYTAHRRSLLIFSEHYSSGWSGGWFSSNNSGFTPPDGFLDVATAEEAVRARDARRRRRDASARAAEVVSVRTVHTFTL